MHSVTAAFLLCVLPNCLAEYFDGNGSPWLLSSGNGNFQPASYSNYESRSFPYRYQQKPSSYYPQFYTSPGRNIYEDFARQSNVNSAIQNNIANDKTIHSDGKSPTAMTSAVSIPQKSTDPTMADAHNNENEQLRFILNMFGAPNNLSRTEGRSSALDFDHSGYPNSYMNVYNNYDHPDFVPHEPAPHIGSPSVKSPVSHLQMPAAHGGASPLLLTAIKGFLQGGPGMATASSALSKLPAVLVQGLLIKVASTLAKSGLKGLIAKILVPLLLLVGVDVLIIALIWWLWDDSCSLQAISGPVLPTVPVAPVPYQPY